MTVEISVITPWLDHPEFILDYERAVSAPGVEAIIVDNGSAKANAAQLRQMTERMGGQYIRNEENRWFAAANNQGLAAAKGKIILFLNNDIYGDPDWLNQVRADVTPDAIFGPVIYSQTVDERTIFFHEGWCVAGVREVWDLLSGWDAEHHSMPYYEDRDLGFRAQNAGLKLIQTSWRIGHKGKGTSPEIPGIDAGIRRVRHHFLERVHGRATPGSHPLQQMVPSLESATQIFRDGFLPEAERAFSMLVKAEPTRVEAWERYAEVLHLSGRQEAATEALRQAIQLDPFRLSPRINLGIILGRMGLHGEAALALRAAVQCNPSSAEAHVNLSRALSSSGDFSGAADAAGKAVELQPSMGLAHANLSNALRELGRLPEALAAAQSAIIVQDNLPASWNSLGAALRAMNRLQEALLAFDRSYNLTGHNRIAEKNRNEIRALLAEGARRGSRDHKKYP